MTFHITVNLDEISDKLDDSLKFLNRLSIKSCELRMINTKNIIQLSDAELRLNINFESHSRQFIKSSDILSSNDIENLKLRALFLLQEEKQYPHGLSEVEWDGILSNTINNIYRYSSEEHSLYLLPLYLLRVYNYLKYN